MNKSIRIRREWKNQAKKSKNVNIYIKKEEDDEEERQGGGGGGVWSEASDHTQPRARPMLPPSHKVVRWSPPQFPALQPYNFHVFLLQ